MTPEHESALILLRIKLQSYHREIGEISRNMSGPPYPLPAELREMEDRVEILEVGCANVENRIAQILRLYEGV